MRIPRCCTLTALALAAGCAASMRPDGTPADAVSYTGNGVRGGAAYAVAIHLDAHGNGTVALDSDCRGGARILASSVVRTDSVVSFRAFGCSGRTVGLDVVNAELGQGVIRSAGIYFLERRELQLTRIGNPIVVAAQ